MSDLVHVLHPVVHRYLPPRGRAVRIGIAEGTTACRLLHAEDAPVEVARLGHERIYACGGFAWTTLLAYGEPATPRQLETFLRLGAARTRGTGYVEPYHREVERSPLHYRGETGNARPAIPAAGPRGGIVEDGSDTASRRTREYLDETFRIADDRVLVRVRHLVVASEIHRATPLLQTRTYPRVQDPKAMLGLRHDRIGDLVAMKGGRMRLADGETRDWNQMRSIPSALLDDHDIEYAANAMPGRVARMAQHWVQGDPRTESQNRLHALMPTLVRLQEDSWTHGIAGDRVEPALVAVRSALADILSEHAFLEAECPTRTPRPGHVAARLMHDMVDRVHLPRWRTRDGVAPEDDAALCRLAM
jgi:hypothetical protein